MSSTRDFAWPVPGTKSWEEHFGAGFYNWDFRSTTISVLPTAIIHPRSAEDVSCTRVACGGFSGPPELGCGATLYSLPTKWWLIWTQRVYASICYSMFQTFRKMKDSSLACGKRIKTCRQKNGFVGPLEVEHRLIGYVAIYEVLVAAPASKNSRWSTRNFLQVLDTEVMFTASCSAWSVALVKVSCDRRWWDSAGAAIAFWDHGRKIWSSVSCLNRRFWKTLEKVLSLKIGWNSWTVNCIIDRNDTNS